MLLCAALAAAGLPSARATADTVEGGPDAAAYGQALGYPVAPPNQNNVQRFMVGSYSHFDAIYPARVVARAPLPRPLKPAPVALSVAYTFRGQPHTLDDYLARNAATGLLVARGGTILFERYQYGRTAADRMTSQSMAKTVVAMLVGIAISEHAIRSVDDQAAAYVPELAGMLAILLIGLANGGGFGFRDGEHRTSMVPGWPNATTRHRPISERIRPGGTITCRVVGLDRDSKPNASPTCEK